MCINENNIIDGQKWRERGDQWMRLHTFDQSKIDIIHLIEGENKYNKKNHDKKWTLQFLTALYNSID
jgi:hypothetical protein